MLRASHSNSEIPPLLNSRVMWSVQPSDCFGSCTVRRRHKDKWWQEVLFIIPPHMPFKWIFKNTIKPQKQCVTWAQTEITCTEYVVPVWVRRLKTFISPQFFQTISYILFGTKPKLLKLEIKLFTSTALDLASVPFSPAVKQWPCFCSSPLFFGVDVYLFFFYDFGHFLTL